MKKKRTILILFIVVFVISFIYNFIYFPLNGDEIWNFGFGYAIARGEIPYRDFNMVITPLYSFFIAILISIFGSHLIIMHIFNSILVSLLCVTIYLKLGKKFFLIFPILLLISQPGYNFFSLFLAFLIIFVFTYNFSKKDIILGLLVGLLFLCKQNIGFLFLFPLLFGSKNRMKSLISFLIPILIFCIYLIYYSAFNDFINFCFLGLFDFGKSNFEIYFFIPFLLTCFYLFYSIIKSRFTDITAMYVLCFQALAFPIFDYIHFFTPFVLFLYYIFSRHSLKNNDFIIFQFTMILIFLFFGVNDFSFFLSLEDNSFLEYRNIGDECVEKGLKEITTFIKKEKSYDSIYIVDDFSYLIKINLNDDITQYDLLNNGNMGYRGSRRIISEINNDCLNNKCMFIVKDYVENTQLNHNIYNYVVDNYSFYKEVDIFRVYSNYEFGDIYE